MNTKTVAFFYASLFLIWLAGPAGAGTFVDDFENCPKGGAFANASQPGSAPVKGWWSESYYWKPDVAGASVVIVSPTEQGPGGGRCMQLFGMNDTPRVSNFFGPHEHSGVRYDGSVGQPLTGSGNRLQWDAFSKTGQFVTFQIFDPSGETPALSISIKPDGLWVNGANLGAAALGTSETAWRQFEISKLDVGAGTFDLKVSVWDRGTQAFKGCHTALGLRTRGTPLALQSFVVFFDGITGGHEAVLIDNFHVVSTVP